MLAIRMRLVSTATAALVCIASCNADVLVFQDLTETVSVTINGVPLTGNGGRVSNFTLSGESVSFDLTAPGVAQQANSGFTNLLDDPAGSGDPIGSVK